MEERTPQVQWGWRIQCADPDCDHYLETWGVQEYGGNPHTPELPYAKTLRAERGWFFQSIRFHLEGAWDPRKRVYRAYCPEHSVPVFQWQDDLKVWRTKRWNQGKEVSDRIGHKIKEWGAKVFNRRVGESVEDWIARNPEPTPPWKEAV